MENLENILKIPQDKRTLESTSEYREFRSYIDKINLGLYTLRPKDREKVKALIVYKLVLNEGCYDKDSLLKRISAYSGVFMKDIKFGGRGSKLDALRNVTYHAYKCLGLSFPKVGKNVGGKDHATVINGCYAVNEYIAKYKEFVDLVFLNRQPSGEEMYNALGYDKE